MRLGARCDEILALIDAVLSPPDADGAERRQPAPAFVRVDDTRRTSMTARGSRLER